MYNKWPKNWFAIFLQFLFVFNIWQESCKNAYER